MKFLFIFNIAPLKEGFFGMTIRNSTLAALTCLIIIKIFNISTLYYGRLAETQMKYSTYIFTIYFWLNLIKIFFLFVFYINIFTYKFKKSLFSSQFIVATIISINFFLCMALSINPFIEEIYFQKNSKEPKKEQGWYHYLPVLMNSLQIFFVLKIIFLLDIFFFYPIYSFYINIKDKKFSILDRPHEDNVKAIKSQIPI